MIRTYQGSSYNAGVTAFMPRLVLEPWREWRDMLTDMRIGKISVASHTVHSTGHSLACGRPQPTVIIHFETGDTRNWLNRMLAAGRPC